MRDLRAAIRNQPPADHPYDWDPLHMPGAVQSYGTLLVAEPGTRRVIFASENAGAMLGVPAADIINKSYLLLTDSESERRVMQEKIRPDTILFPNPVRMTIQGRAFDAIFHAQGADHLIELEPVRQDGADYDTLADRAVAEMFEPSTVADLYQRAVNMVRTATGFDRVMLYRFDARANGQVLAESRRDGIGSFLGLFFPSGDISSRARELYMKNFTRYIPDLGGETHALAGVYPGGGRAESAYPVDMSLTNLRCVAPCHVTYLRNMGVGASISFSISVDDRLWGLFACHHYKPKTVSFDQRTVCEQTAMMFIYKLSALNSTAARMAQRAAGVQRLAETITAGADLGRRIQALQSASGPQSAAHTLISRTLAALHEETHFLLAPADLPPPAEKAAPLTPGQTMLLDLAEADSAAVLRHGRVYRIGDAPSAMAIIAIAGLFGRELPDLGRGNLPVFATDCLSAAVPAAEDIKDRAAGIMAASLSDDEPALILWFRREQIVHATWAGNPNDDAMSEEAGSFNPRASFAAWKQDIRNLSRPWMPEDVEAAYDLVQAVRAAEGRPPRAEAPPAMRVVPPPAPGAAQGGVTAPPFSPSITPPGATPSGLVPAGSTRPRRVIRIGQI